MDILLTIQEECLFITLRQPCPWTLAKVMRTSPVRWVHIILIITAIFTLALKAKKILVSIPSHFLVHFRFQILRVRIWGVFNVEILFKKLGQPLLTSPRLVSVSVYFHCWISTRIMDSGNNNNRLTCKKKQQ